MGKKVLKVVSLVIAFIAASGIIGVLLVFYGPFTSLRDTIVTSAMTTSSHQYIAKWFLSDDEIRKIMSRNYVKQPSENTNAGEINTAAGSSGIRFINIAKGKCSGYLLIVDDPSRVSIGTSNGLPSQGQTVDEIVKQYEAAAGINAGGFASEKSGLLTPEGIIIENGKIKYYDSRKYYSIIGFNSKNVLILGNYTLSQILRMNIRDAVMFYPFLIVNGKQTQIVGDGGWGVAPRAAIGQTKDGKVLLLTLNGRKLGDFGATMKDVQDIMEEYGAYNAANLDGGYSTTMVYGSKVVTRITSSRDVPSAFIVKGMENNK